MAKYDSLPYIAWTLSKCGVDNASNKHIPTLLQRYPTRSELPTPPLADEPAFHNWADSIYA